MIACPNKVIKKYEGVPWAELLHHYFTSVNKKSSKFFPVEAVGKAKLVKHGVAALTRTARVGDETPLSITLTWVKVPARDRPQNLAEGWGDSVDSEELNRVENARGDIPVF